MWLTGFPLELTALIEGRTTASVWDFGDGVVVSNQPYASHAWTAPGDYAVVLRAYNESHPGGVSATVTVHVVAQPVHYVAAGSPIRCPPYTLGPRRPRTSRMRWMWRRCWERGVGAGDQRHLRHRRAGGG